MSAKPWAVVKPERWTVGRTGTERYAYTRWAVLKRYAHQGTAARFAAKQQAEGVMACVLHESSLLQGAREQEARTFERHAKDDAEWKAER